MQFTHTPSPCGIHTKYPQKTTYESPEGKDQPRSHVMKPSSPGLLNEGSLTSKQGVLVQSASLSDSKDDDTNIYKAELLAQWGLETSAAYLAIGKYQLIPL